MVIHLYTEYHISLMEASCPDASMGVRAEAALRMREIASEIQDLGPLSASDEAILEEMDILHLL